MGPEWGLMRIIAISHLKAFSEKHPASKQPLLSWIDEARQARWSTPADIKAQFGNASILKSRRVVFNIKGNDSIAAVTKVMKEEESEEDTDADINEVNEGETSTETPASEE